MKIMRNKWLLRVVLFFWWGLLKVVERKYMKIIIMLNCVLNIIKLIVGRYSARPITIFHELEQHLIELKIRAIKSIAKLGPRPNELLYEKWKEYLFEKYYFETSLVKIWAKVADKASGNCKRKPDRSLKWIDD